MPLRDRPAPRAGDGTLALGVFVALFASVLPLLRVVEPGPWLLGVLVFTAAILSVGSIARRCRLPAAVVSLIEAAIWAVLLSLVFFRDTSLFGVIPTVETVATIGPTVQRAGEEIALGVAPLTAGRPLAFLIIGAVGLLAIIVDHVVIAARLPLVAAVAVIAVWLIPSIAVPGNIDITGFVLLAAAILFLVRVETRTRPQRQPAAASAPPAPARTTSASATAFAIGAVAVVVALVVTPLLPAPETRAAGFGMSGVAINPTLRLGDDLRQPSEVEVLAVRTTAPEAPYLRVVTLSSFNGRVWEPDRRSVVPLGVDAALGPVTVDSDIDVDEYETEIEVRSLQTQWLPVPFPAVAVEGLNDQWSAMPYNRTVVGTTTTTSGLTYTVRTQVPEPTLEQIRARAASGVDATGGLDRTTALAPTSLPEQVGIIASEVTAEASTDYDKLIALQAWFRGPEFTYSLQAPVEQDFDGSGLRAVATFLEVKEGYCVHFASAFALMARTLGMSSRIAVGYLPGTMPAGIPPEAQTAYTVSSSQLHAWPEVFFPGIGWVPFEPTKSLGNPTGFSPAASNPADRVAGQDPLLDPAAGPTAGPSVRPELPDEQLPGEAGGVQDAPANPLPWTLGAAGVVALLLLPALLRELRRRRQHAAAQRGEVAAAWTSVQDAAIDLGIPVSASETPRAFGARLVTAHGAPPKQMNVLVNEIEHASYAQGGVATGGRLVANAASHIRRALLGAVGTSSRVRALLLPRSLAIRPGSVYAGITPQSAPNRGATYTTHVRTPPPAKELAAVTNWFLAGQNPDAQSKSGGNS